MIKFSINLCIALIIATTAYNQTLNQPKYSTDRYSTDLPYGFNELFAGSGECLLCHNDMTDANGVSIGILNDWRSTMMANSAKDPFWRAKVSHEILVNPADAEVLEEICTSCHAPLGNFNAHHLGQTNYSIWEMAGDSLAMDGVSCTLCHQIREETFGTYSGNLIIDTNKTIYGQYPNPFSNPMINHTGYTPTFSDHIRSARVCGSCHTLITNSVDLDGHPTGESFVEQSIYHEWLNSSYPANDQTCISCHVPEIPDIVKVSSRPPWLDGRAPFGKHHLVGANIFMYQILKDNIQLLSLTAEPQQFDSTISRTAHLLQESALSVELKEIDRSDLLLQLELSIQNMTGHKFPTGFPSRRAFVEIIAWDVSGDTLMHSGRLNEDYTLVGENSTFEEHHLAIQEDGDVQIYEMVAGDVNNDVTTVLERAYMHLKDNRIPPMGFSSAHNVYDTVRIAGGALSDENFNKLNGEEGTGKDILDILIPTNGTSSEINVQANIYYQTTSPKWLSEMFAHSSAEIDLWKDLFLNSDRQPILVAQDNYVSSTTHIEQVEENSIAVYPNPAIDRIFIEAPENIQMISVDIYSLKGDKICSKAFQSNSGELGLSLDPGIFLLSLTTSSSQKVIKKIIIN